MKCPICGNHEAKQFDYNSFQFHEEHHECEACGAVWSVNHGCTEIVNDVQKNSFLAATSELVECDDYVFV